MFIIIQSRLHRASGDSVMIPADRQMSAQRWNVGFQGLCLLRCGFSFIYIYMFSGKVHCKSIQFVYGAKKKPPNKCHLLDFRHRGNIFHTSPNKSPLKYTLCVSASHIWESVCEGVCVCQCVKMFVKLCRSVCIYGDIVCDGMWKCVCFSICYLVRPIFDKYTTLWEPVLLLMGPNAWALWVQMVFLG